MVFVLFFIVCLFVCLFVCFSLGPTDLVIVYDAILAGG